MGIRMTANVEPRGISDLATALGDVSNRRARYVAEEASRKRGVGRKIGRVWVFTQAEIDEIVKWKRGKNDHDASVGAGDGRPAPDER